MSDVRDAVSQIEATAKRLGLAEMSRRSGVAYTTLSDMRSKGWRPKSIQIFERLLSLPDADVDAATPSDDAA